MVPLSPSVRLHAQLTSNILFKFPQTHRRLDPALPQESSTHPRSMADLILRSLFPPRVNLNDCLCPSLDPINYVEFWMVLVLKVNQWLMANDTPFPMINFCFVNNCLKNA